MAVNPFKGGSVRADAGVEARPGQFTDAHIVLLDPSDMEAGMSALRSGAGVAQAEHVRPSDREGVSQLLSEGGSIVFGEIGVAVVTADPDQHESLIRAAGEAPQVLRIEPERMVYASTTLSPEYLVGYRDAVNALVEEALSSTGNGGQAAPTLARVWDETRTTWGLQATRVAESSCTGRGVRVAVLDTGMDLTHRDFLGRTIKTMSFIPGETVQDGNGHGTHCIGTACGPKAPQVLPRYGVACDAEIFAGKVLNDAGRGSDRGILAGINWAVSQECRVISMSLGAPTEVGDTYSRVYEAVAQRALEKGTLIVAAAGNNGPKPVSHPANCPSIMAVGAITPDFTVAPFSCIGINPDGGQVDIAAPGVNVYSSYKEPTGYRRLAGTSMATPHVAGVVALLAEAFPHEGPAQLKLRLLSSAQHLPLPSTDVGVGLVQAP
jgi:subtilisin family serine protease